MSANWHDKIRTSAGFLMLASVPALLSAGCDDGITNVMHATSMSTNTSVADRNTAETAGLAKASWLFIDMDIVRGTKNLTSREAVTQGCVQASVFAKNEQIVFRFRIVDPGTGREVEPEEIDEIVVRFKDGRQLPRAAYGPHPKELPSNSYWTAYFVIPPDFPAGTIDYTVTATHKDGRVGQFTPLRFSQSGMLTVMDKIRDPLDR